MTDRKRQEDRERRERDKAKVKESSLSSKEKFSKRRKEIWIHPDGGKRSHRTTSTSEPAQDIEEDELSKLSQAEVNIVFFFKLIFSCVNIRAESNSELKFMSNIKLNFLIIIIIIRAIMK